MGTVHKVVTKEGHASSDRNGNTAASGKDFARTALDLCDGNPGVISNTQAKLVCAS
jgi:hypothetical protein